MTTTIRPSQAARRVGNVCAMLGVPSEDWSLFAPSTEGVDGVELTADELHLVVGTLLTSKPHP